MFMAHFRGRSTSLQNEGTSCGLLRMMERALVLSACLMASPLYAASVPGQGELTLIYGASLPEIADEHGGLPALAGLAERARAAGPTCLLFGGDSLGPSMLGALDKGGHMIDVLNQMNLDVMGVSKREFLFHEDELSLRAAEAFFPLVCANIDDPLTDGNLAGLENSALITRGGRTLGFFALLGEELMHAYPPQRVRLKHRDASLRAEAASLRSRGADTVVLMTDFTWPEAETYLDDGVIDVLLNNNGQVNRNVPTKRGIYVQIDNSGYSALELTLPSGEVRFHALKDIPASQTTRAKVDYYLARLDKILNVNIGVTKTAFDTRRVSVRTEENAFGNFVADAVREALNADVALINGGVIRGNREYAAGQMLLRRDLRGELPFHDQVALLEVDGKALRAALENGLSQIEEVGGRFPHVSGMRVTYDPSRPSGRRVISVTVGDCPLRDDRRYILATTNFISIGGDEYTMLSGNRLSLSPMLLGDVVRQRVESLGSIAPVVDRRMSAEGRGTPDISEKAGHNNRVETR